MLIRLILLFLRCLFLQSFHSFGWNFPPLVDQFLPLVDVFLFHLDASEEEMTLTKCLQRILNIIHQHVEPVLRLVISESLGTRKHKINSPRKWAKLLQQIEVHGLRGDVHGVVEWRLDGHEPHDEACGLASWVVEAVGSGDGEVLRGILEANQTENFSENNSVLPLNLPDSINRLSLHP